MEAQEITHDEPFSQSQEKFDEITSWLDSNDAHAMTHGALERRLDEDGRELLRRLMQEHVSRRPSRSLEVVVGADDTERTDSRSRSRNLQTVFGTIEVERVCYGAPGHQCLAPLDAELNLPPESYSHGIRRKVALEAAQISFDNVVVSVEEATGVKVPKRQVEQLAQRAAMDFDEFYKQRRRPGKNERTGPLLVLTTDGKGVVMRHEHLRPATKRAAEKSNPKLAKRTSKGEKRNRKRMSQVAAVYTVGRFVRMPEEILGELNSVGGHEGVTRPRRRPKPEHKRVWASLEKEPEEVVKELVEEGLLRDPRKRKHWVALIDGHPHQLSLVNDALEHAGVEATVILDIIHVLEYLWKASHVFFGEASSTGEEWVTERLRRILQGEAVHVAAGIRRSGTLRGLTGSKRDVVDTCADYILGHAQYMRYDEYLAEGLPIATGVIEGACRHLVKDRMDITGARWSLSGGEAVLRLRALRVSHDFDEYWQFHEAQEYARNHAARYADEHVPMTESHHGCHLRLVR